MKNILSRFLKNLREALFKPEAWWKLAGGEASPRAGTTGSRPQRRMRPGRGAGNFPSVPAPLPGCIPFYQCGPGVSPPANIHAALRAAFALAALLIVLIPRPAVADEPFFKKGDVIALVGGEDMVAMSEYGYLELLLTRALPEHRLKFRNLAWEGDTVFEQRRDLNFPPLEAQLDQVGATVVLCQFGQMESLAGKEKLPEFVAAYRKLIERIKAGGKRKVVIVEPTSVEPKTAWSNRRSPELTKRLTEIQSTARIYERVISEMRDDASSGAAFGMADVTSTRDGIHSNETWALLDAKNLASRLVDHEAFRDTNDPARDGVRAAYQPLLKAITAKNRLWFDYWRVQNWAFLAGDRTEQPSSRDHVDRTQRWFLAEREQFLPLIDAKEQEIWTLAAKLSEQK